MLLPVNPPLTLTHTHTHTQRTNSLRNLPPYHPCFLPNTHRLTIPSEIFPINTPQPLAATKSSFLRLISLSLYRGKEKKEQRMGEGDMNLQDYSWFGVDKHLFVVLWALSLRACSVAVCVWRKVNAARCRGLHAAFQHSGRGQRQCGFVFVRRPHWEPLTPLRQKSLLSPSLSVGCLSPSLPSNLGAPPPCSAGNLAACNSASCQQRSGLFFIRKRSSSGGNDTNSLLHLLGSPHHL